MTPTEQAEKLLDEIRSIIKRGVYAFNPKSIHANYETNYEKAVRDMAIWYCQKMKNITEPFEGDYWFDVETVIIKKIK